MPDYLDNENLLLLITRRNQLMLNIPDYSTYAMGLIMSGYFPIFPLLSTAGTMLVLMKSKFLQE